MRVLLSSLLLALLILVIGAAGFVYSGLYDVGATTPHWPFTTWLLTTARIRSIGAHAAGIEPPAGYDSAAQLAIGIDHFAAHCAVCHGAPGVPRGAIAKGLYPQPPDLAVAVKQYKPGELFWILKHGIKMTGMPSWANHSDDELWATVGFLEQLPGMSEQDYVKQLMAALVHGGHHHSD
jgi:mono/diheme cytochrome c family protein